MKAGAARAITVVTDPDFGPTAIDVPGEAFWLVSSPENRGHAARLHQAGSYDPNSAVFDARETTPPEVALDTFASVAEHHPDWTCIEFVGTQLTAELRRTFAIEDVAAEETPAGFVLRRR